MFILAIIHRLSLWVMLRFNSFSDQFFNSFGVSRYFSVRKPLFGNPDQYHDPNLDRFLTRLGTMLVAACDIKICLGEMGHTMVDDPRIITALRAAYLSTGKPAVILHGPKVDPKTKALFTLWQEGMVELREMEVFTSHHFVLLTNRDGSISIADENPHNEGLWKEIAPGKFKSLYRSLYRVWYIRENSKGYAAILQHMFAERKQRSRLTVERPTVVYERIPPVVRRTLKVAAANAFARYVGQPLSLISDADSAWFSQHRQLANVWAFYTKMLLNKDGNSKPNTPTIPETGGVKKFTHVLRNAAIFWLAIARGGLRQDAHHSVNHPVEHATGHVIIVDDVTSSETLDHSTHEPGTNPQRQPRPIWEFVKRFAYNEDALLKLDDFFGLLVEYQAFYSPEPEPGLICDNSPKEINQNLYSVVGSFPGSEQDKHLLVTEAVWLQEQLSHPETHKEADDYLTNMTKVIAQLIEHTLPSDDVDDFLTSLAEKYAKYPDASHFKFL